MSYTLYYVKLLILYRHERWFLTLREK